MIRSRFNYDDHHIRMPFAYPGQPEEKEIKLRFNIASRSPSPEKLGYYFPYDNDVKFNAMFHYFDKKFLRMLVKPTILNAYMRQDYTLGAYDPHKLHDQDAFTLPMMNEHTHKYSWSGGEENKFSLRTVITELLKMLIWPKQYGNLYGRIGAIDPFSMPFYDDLALSEFTSTYASAMTLEEKPVKTKRYWVDSYPLYIYDPMPLNGLASDFLPAFDPRTLGDLDGSIFKEFLITGNIDMMELGEFVTYVEYIQTYPLRKYSNYTLESMDNMTPAFFIEQY